MAAAAGEASTSRRRAGGGDAPLGHEHQAIGPVRGPLQVVHDGEDGDAGGADLVDTSKEGQLMADVQMRGGLVEQEDLRLLGQPPRHGRELALPGQSVPTRRSARPAIPVIASACATAA